MDIEALYKIYQQFPNVQTDTRQLKEGDIFFALKGPSFNGNSFAQTALDNGAACVVIDDPEYAVPEKTFLVPDVLTALQQLANYHRKNFTIPFIAITGSNGKTTTKELIHVVLSQKYKVYTTEGNLNNHIGVPLTVLKIKADAEIAVIEMGANHLHEIESYCNIAEPTHGLITNCGKAHLEGFGSVEGVRKGKGELFDYLRTKNNATAFIMRDYEYLIEMSQGIANIITYGTKNAHITGNVHNASTLLQVNVSANNKNDLIKTNLVGSYNLPNVLAAVAVGNEFSVELENVKTAIENYQPSNSRSQLIQLGSNNIILDAYNANPSSMKLAIENFSHVKNDHKILMLGAMAEMGAESVIEHENLIKQIKKHAWENVILVGKPFELFNNEYLFFSDVNEAAAWLDKEIIEDSYLLIKGSRSSKMEKLIDVLRKKD